MNGFLCVLKPPGMTSSDVVVHVRRKLGKKIKVGHAGTLDPEAAGVLPLMIGKAARLFDHIVEKEKRYTAELVTGYETDTQDVHGTIVSGEGKRADRTLLASVIPSLTGDIEQIPPMFSALKRDGQKLCDLARQGISIDVQPRPIHIEAIRIMHDLGDGRFLIDVRCGRGTYIRTLCHDLGRAMGCGACMGLLIRTASGVFDLDHAVTLEAIDAAEDLSELLLPMDHPIGHLPRLQAEKRAERFVRCGNALTRDELAGEAEEGQPARVYLGDVFCGIGHFTENTFKFDAMLLE